MAAVLKILEDFYDETFALMAIHSDLEDYALAYAINRTLKTRLQRSRQDLDLSAEVLFPYFEWKDPFAARNWVLFTNRSTSEEVLNFSGLFSDERASKRYPLVPEYKDVDYFLKIEQDDVAEDKSILKALQSIPKVIMAYTINANELKSKQNLIF